MPEPILKEAEALVVSPETYRQRQIVAAKEAAAKEQLDQTVTGGRYKVGDQWVNAKGEPIKADEKKSA